MNYRIGNHNELLKPDRKCFYCGDTSSFEHCFANCDWLRHDKVDLKALLTDDDSIKLEFKKLRDIYDDIERDALRADCTGKKLTIDLDGVVGDAVVLSRLSNSSIYKCQCVLTGDILTIDIGKLLSIGKISLSRGGAHDLENT